ncbi:MAG: DUF3365 domain-containing protein, partial [Fidelibacterota bacterium]
LILVWTAFWGWHSVSHRRMMETTTMANLHNQAVQGISNVVLFSRWNALHGGVYVPVNDYGQPNPYLQGLVKRDIITPGGDSLTLINPAYMTRQFFEIQERDTDMRGHITSLKPIRPENAPDPWERKALQAFETGAAEESTVEEIGAIPYYRLMRPLITEKACLKCHRQQGYKEGDIRGGLSVSIPISDPMRRMQEDINRRDMFDFIFWVLGLAGIIFGYVLLQKTDLNRAKFVDEILKLNKKTDHLNSELNEANALKLMLIDVMTHDLRKPLQVISGFSELALNNHPDDPLITRIDQNVARLFETLDNVSALAQTALGESIPLKSMDLIPTVRNVANEFQNLLEAGEMTLDLNLPERCIVIAHPIIREVFRNYLSNAIKYAADGKRVVLEVEEAATEVIIRVRDFGSETIPEEKYEDLFNRHFRDDDDKQGRGLGLFIVKRLAEALHGTAWVEPNRPQGNVFAFSIPRT